MQKRTLKTYLNRNIKDYLKVNCFEFENGYLITDNYSVIKLNNNYDLQVNEDKYGVSRIYHDFDMNYNYIQDLTSYINYDMEEQELNIELENKRYSMNIKLIKRIKKLINFDKVELLSTYSMFVNEYNYVIKLTNTKTNEVAYLLPMKVY